MTAGTELCSSCGAAVQEGDHFCSDCGSPTVAPAVPAQYPQSAHRYQGPEVAYAPLQPLRPYAPHTTNGLAIASMVLGILWISGLGSISRPHLRLHLQEGRLTGAGATRPGVAWPLQALSWVSSE